MEKYYELEYLKLENARLQKELNKSDMRHMRHVLERCMASKK